MTPPDDQRPGKRERTRALIVTTCREMLQDIEELNEAPTLDQIAEEAGLVRATLANHFSTKSELIRAVVDDVFDSLWATMWRQRHPDVDQRAMPMFDTLVEMAEILANDKFVSELAASPLRPVELSMAAETAQGILRNMVGDLLPASIFYDYDRRIAVETFLADWVAQLAAPNSNDEDRMRASDHLRVLVDMTIAYGEALPPPQVTPGVRPLGA